jgi:hypothetical protein
LAFFLIASPSLGAQYANFAAAVAPLYNAQLEILKFSQTNHWLNTLDKDFLNLKEGGRLLINGKELIEDQFAATSSLLRFNQIVPPWTGAKYFGNPIKIPRSDHITIAKPTASSDLQHRLLVEFISTVCGEQALIRPGNGHINSEDRLVVDWGSLIQEEKADESEPSPLHIGSLLRLRLWSMVLAAIVLCVVAFYYGRKWLGGDETPYSYSQTTSAARPYTDLGVAIGAMVSDIEENCRRGWMERRWLGQKCAAAHMNSGIAALRACQSFDFRSSAPEDALRLVVNQFPRCVSLKSEGESFSISVRQDSTTVWQNHRGSWILCDCSAEQIRILETQSQ